MQEAGPKLDPPKLDERSAERVVQHPATRDLFERSRSLVEASRYREALECLRLAHHADPDHAQVRSLLGVCLAMQERRFEEAVELCTSAAKQEFFNPELYLNLALVYLNFGFKTEGIRFLLRGQMIDPANETIRRELADLGNRVSPVLRFLPRRHLINRWLGSARSALVRREERRLAA
ncbi:MAG: tetratricopeptide repeat protein [Deltaproteobacteria bacterium]|nr:tetratricopeptide repeat protein [Deltaproteobacteria bacterium]MBW2419493.1 tetratricopeptide repeat protein [Deltaproteobacteria bacterium]